VGSNLAGLTNKINKLSQKSNSPKNLCVCTVSALTLLDSGRPIFPEIAFGKPMESSEWKATG
jgi:hypothetical protein